MYNVIQFSYFFPCIARVQWPDEFSEALAKFGEYIFFDIAISRKRDCFASIQEGNTEIWRQRKRQIS